MSKVMEVYYSPGRLDDYYVFYESRRGRYYPTEEKLPEKAKEFLSHAKCDKLAGYDPPVYKYTSERSEL